MSFILSFVHLIFEILLRVLFNESFYAGEENNHIYSSSKMSSSTNPTEPVFAHNADFNKTFTIDTNTFLCFVNTIIVKHEHYKVAKDFHQC